MNPIILLLFLLASDLECPTKRDTDWDYYVDEQIIEFESIDDPGCP